MLAPLRQAQALILEALLTNARLDAGETFVLEELRARLALRFDLDQVDRLTRELAQQIDTATSHELAMHLSPAQRTVSNLVARNVIDQFRTRNVALVQTLVGKQLDDLKVTLAKPANVNLHPSALRPVLQQRFGVSASRAELWARDQTLKLHGQITEQRYQAAGVTEYIWTSSGDERVRESHADLDGTQQTWANPPVTNDAGDTNNPGLDYECRCTAYPVI